MKLLNYTTSYFAVILLLVISVWAVVYYYTMLNEIYDSIDDGLDNQKQLIIRNASADTSLLNKADFGEGGYRIHPVRTETAVLFSDSYMDTLMYMENEDEYEPVRLLKTVFNVHGSYYSLEVATSMVEEDDLVNSLVHALVWLYLGIVLPVLLLNNFLLRKVWKPFYRLLEQLKRFRLDKPEPITTAPSKIEEFRLLNTTVQKMVQNSRDAYASQKDFTENAAHELQTPLAIAINKLEHLAENNELNEEQLSLLSSAMDHLDRLTRLNRSLLLLSKIENHQYHEVKVINLRIIVENLLKDMDTQLQYKELIIEQQIDDCSVEMNEALAGIMVTNIIKNAVVHTAKGGTIRIVLLQNSFTVINTGNASLDAKNLFSRFNKQSDAKHSTGLGLSIVKAITDLYQFSLQYRFEGQHIVQVRFP